jgi:AraC family transcriptional regulator, regulatory protein of adaptative response / DNA-3-methyladenine glycosylase II
MPDVQACERARLSRDARFDGLFFTAVTSTGIYCRPVCPAPAPKPQHVMYVPSAAAAEAAGFRPCLRCRPELAPGDPSWRRGDDVVARALALIDEGILVDAPLGALADRLALGERQLRRLFVDRLGVAPVGVHGTRRLLLAKQLLTDSSMPITDIALAAGFNSLRRFNTVFREAYRMAPRDLRRTAGPATGDTLTLRLGYRPPYDFGAMLDFLRARALPGIEQVDDSSYARVFGSEDAPGWLRVSRSPGARGAHALRLELHGSRPTVLLAVVSQVRRLFDLDADPASIGAVLGIDRRLRPLLARWPGLRLPGAWDGFETAVRAVVGQQVSVAAARTIAARLVARFGRPLPETFAAHGFSHLFPAPAALADADLSGCGLTPDRARTIRHVARAVVDGRVDFHCDRTLDEIVARWTELPGIGPWTAHYIAMRAFGHPDALPAEDLVLRRALSEGGTPLTARALRVRAEAWKPWRAYAVIHLWREAAAIVGSAFKRTEARHRRAGAAGSPRTSSSSHTGAHP